MEWDELLDDAYIKYVSGKDEYFADLLAYMDDISHLNDPYIIEKIDTIIHEFYGGIGENSAWDRLENLLSLCIHEDDDF